MKSFLFFLLFIGEVFMSVAQQPVITKVAKFKPPLVKTWLGIRSNGDSVTTAEAAQLIGLPMQITDAKKNTYAVSSYGFLYKRKSVITDEQTGRKSITFTTVADKFKSTPLPEVWINNLKDGFQKDEELYFFDVVAKDNMNRIFFAPDLKIIIQ
ncbi:MAG: hypothetical protein ABI472_19420 [Ginsengibacter sp.]